MESENVRKLRDEIKSIKLSRELEKLKDGAKPISAPKSRNDILKQEIKEIEAKKLNVGQGWRGGLRKMALNAEINKRKQMVFDSYVSAHLEDKKKIETLKSDIQKIRTNRPDLINYDDLTRGVKF